MEQPLVTVAIPLYNYETFVAEAIRSVLAQTWAHVECLVLDNASTDRSLEVARSFDDPRVRVIAHPENLGIIGNHQAGLDQARGDFFVWLSADDQLLPTAVADAMAVLQRDPEIDVLYRPYIRVDEAGRWLGVQELPGFFGAAHYADRNEAALLLSTDSFVVLPTVVFRTELLRSIGGMDPTFQVGADYELFLRLALAGHRFAFDAAPAVLVRGHAGNRSGMEKYIVNGGQVEEYLRLFARFLTPENHALLAGHRTAIATAFAQRRAAFAHFGSDLVVAQFTMRHASQIAAVEAAIAAIPDASPAAEAGEALISVIVPTSGRLQLLRQALDSLVAQDYQNWEAIVVQDGGVDPTPVVAHVGDPRIRVVATRGAAGPAGARNLGVRCARGEVIAYLDDDDLFTPGYLAAVAAQFADAQTQACAVRFSTQIRDGLGQVLAATPFQAPEVGLHAQLLPLGALTHRRSLLDQVGYFNEALPLLEAWDFTLRVALTAPPAELAVDGYIVAVLDTLDGHHLLGRQGTGWNQFAEALDGMYAVYETSNVDVLETRKAYAAAVSAAVATPRASATDVLRFAETMAGRG